MKTICVNDYIEMNVIYKLHEESYIYKEISWKICRTFVKLKFQKYDF